VPILQGRGTRYNQKMIKQPTFPTWPFFADDEISAVTDVLRSARVSYWTSDCCQAFENAFARYLGTEYAIALANGTVALELALYALGIGPGDEVIVPCRTFIATASAVVARGAMPVVVDVDSQTQNITLETITPHVTEKTKAIIAVHLAGLPCDMESITAFAKAHRLRVIEDCAQAHGAKYRNQCVGTFGDVATFSFCQDKIMTTGGEGGMLVTADRDLWKRAWAYKDHGKSIDKINASDHPPGFRWLHEDFGTNWRMTAMQAAIGLAQLEKLDAWLAVRRRNAEILKEELSDLTALSIFEPSDDVEHAYYKLYAFVDPDALRPGWDRDRIMNVIAERGVPCFSGSCPEIYREQAFKKNNIIVGERFKNASELGQTSLMFLVHPTLRDDHMYDMVGVIVDVIKEASHH